MPDTIIESRHPPQRWLEQRQLLYLDVPAAVRDWLFDPSSLTARLVRLCADDLHGGFSVRCLRQAPQYPFTDERKVLGVGSRRLALVRQVKLYCDDTPLVYARSVIPMSTLRGKQRVYANLGNRPLGAMLFADRSMRRGKVMVTCLRPGDALHAMTGAGEAAVWGRRSVFFVGGKPLLVSEYFLPALLERAGRNRS